MQLRWVVALLAFVVQASIYRAEVMELRMPDIVPSKSDTYLCRGFRIPDNETWYITSLGPILVDPEAIHHIIVITCPTLASVHPVWGCGGAPDPKFPDRGSCRSEKYEFMYDWTKGVEEYRYPKGVAFKVGGDPQYRYLILQVHYSNVSRYDESNPDSSGLKVTYTQDRQPKLAGLMTHSAPGIVEPGRLGIFETVCRMAIPDGRTLRVFSYLVHTHDLGLIASAYRGRNGTLTEMARRSPQLPKSFTPTDVQLRDGDVIVTRCVMYNFDDHPVRNGMTHHDEMCVLRLLYYAEDGEFPPEGICIPVLPPPPPLPPVPAVAAFHRASPFSVVKPSPGQRTWTQPLRRP